MSKKGLLITLILFVGLINSLIFSQERINLSNSSKPSYWPSIVVKLNGEIMVVWTEGEERYADIYYNYYNGTWKGPKVAAARLYDAGFPQLALESDGDIHMVYHDGTSRLNRDIYYKKYSKGSWSGRERVYRSKRNSAWPRIDVESNKIYVCWYHENDTGTSEDIAITWKIDGGSWHTPENCAPNTPNNVSIHPFFRVKNGNYYVCWMDDNHQEGNWNIYYSEKINGKWTELSRRLFPDINQYWPALAVDSDNNVHIIYGTRRNRVHYIAKFNNEWQNPKIISSGKAEITFLYMKFAYNALHAVWRQATGEGKSIFYSKASPTGNWIDPIKVADGENAENPCLDVDSEGYVHVVWQDNGKSNNPDIYYAKILPPGVGTPPVASFSADPTYGFVPLKVKFDASNSYDPDGEIVSYQWDFGDGKTGSGKIVTHTYQDEGSFTATLTVTDNDGLTDTASINIKVVGRPYPPVNVTLERISNICLFYREFINKVKWQKNFKNEGKYNIVLYRIYRKKNWEPDESFTKIIEVNNKTFKYLDREFSSKEEMKKYSYAVSAVDDKNRESLLAKANLINENKETVIDFKKLRIYKDPDVKY